MKKTVNKITICGFGLIGGCMALDFLKGSSRRKNFNITAFDLKPVLTGLKKDKRFNLKSDPKIQQAVEGSDIVILSAPHKANEKMLVTLSKLKSLTDCLIIDTGAVKTPIAKLAQSLNFPTGTQFLPTHPMAGRERKGFENSSDKLFKDHAWYLDETVKLSDNNKYRLDWMVKKLNAVPVYISPTMHDEIVSEISHLPQLISTILGAQINPELIELAGPGLKSMLRLAGSPYSVWSEIIEQNREEIIKALQVYRDNIDLVTKLVKNNKSLSDIFKAASRSYKCLS